MLVFVVVIAIMKDVPDIEGDQQCDVPTFGPASGVDGTLQLCRWTPHARVRRFGVTSIVASNSLSPLIVLATRTSLVVAAIWITGVKVDSKNAKSVYSYYMMLWRLYYLEFLAIPDRRCTAARPLAPGRLTLYTTHHVVQYVHWFVRARVDHLVHR